MALIGGPDCSVSVCSRISPAGVPSPPGVLRPVPAPVGRTIDGPRVRDEPDTGEKDRLMEVARLGVGAAEEANTKEEGADESPAGSVRAGSRISDSRVVGSPSEDAADVGFPFSTFTGGAGEGALADSLLCTASGAAGLGAEVGSASI